MEQIMNGVWQWKPSKMNKQEVDERWKELRRTFEEKKREFEGGQTNGDTNHNS